MILAPIFLAHAVLGLGGILLMIVLAVISSLLDDGSRYLCPRCRASLRPYVKSCRFCRARFKVQQMTPPTRGRAAAKLRSSLQPSAARPYAIPTSTALRQAFCLPPRGHYEAKATVHQKRQLELMGSTNYELIDSLGQDQAKYLINFHEEIQVAERQEREQYALAMRVAQQRRGSMTAALVLVGVVVVIIACVFVGGATSEAAARAEDQRNLVRNEQIRREREASLASTSRPPASRATPPTVTTQEVPTPSAHVSGTASANHEIPPLLARASQTAPVPPPAAFAQNVAYSQQAAVARYPALGMAGSSFNQIFLARLAAWKSVHDPRLERSNWPELLANECAYAITAATPVPTPTPLASSTPTTGYGDYGRYSGSSGGSVYVNGYYRKDGTYVHGYTRRR